MVFSDETVALEIKEGLPCLPEVEREPPRAKEERHVVCVFARVAAKEVILGRMYPKKSDVYASTSEMKTSNLVSN